MRRRNAINVERQVIFRKTAETTEEDEIIEKKTRG